MMDAPQDAFALAKKSNTYTQLVHLLIKWRVTGLKMADRRKLHREKTYYPINVFIHVHSNVK